MQKKRSLLFSQKSFIIDVWLGSKYVSEGYQSILEECGVQKCKLWSVTKAIFIVLIGKIRVIFSFTLAPSTAWKVSVFGIILVCIFPHSDRNQSECWKIQPCSFVKNRVWYSCFLVDFAKFVRTPILQNTSGRLLLLF